MSIALLIMIVLIAIWSITWTAPTASTARSSLIPTGLGGTAIPDGFRTVWTFAANPTLLIYETEVTPPGVDNGEPIKLDSMWNLLGLRIKAPHQLSEHTDGVVKGLYDPQMRSQVDALCGVKTTITVRDYDGGTTAFYGYLKSASHEALKEGEPGMSTLTIVETDWDHVNRVQAGPVYAPVTGS